MASLRYSEHIESDGEVIFRKACELHAEGIVSKRAASPYHSGRGGDWLKLKCVHEQEFVVGGFTELANKSHGVGALLLGYYEDGKLVYAGRTGTGFTQKTHRILRDQLDKLRQSSNALRQSARRSPQGRDLGQTQAGGAGEFCHLDLGWTWSARLRSKVCAKTSQPAKFVAKNLRCRPSRARRSRRR